MADRHLRMRVHPPIAQSVGLYVHFPWCVRLCSYCDFDRQAHGFELVPRYVEALCQEISTLDAAAVHSVFFGGGTPSLMSAGQVRAVLDAARRRLEVLPGAEVTLETNPDDAAGMDFHGLLDAGVTRLSLGVQSLDDRWLRLLGRRHSANGAREAVLRARRGGIANLSLDLMYGLPGLRLADWRATLEGAVALAPEHLSCYLLTIDERVPLGRDVAAGRLRLPDDDELAEQYALTRELLAAAGYLQYEISNWAMPGRESRHNLTYWRDEPYLGIGAGAASSWAGRRFKNTPRIRAYLDAVAGGRRALVEDDAPDWLTAVEDHLALGLRLRAGVDLERFTARFGARLDELAGGEMALLEATGVLERSAGRLRVADAHILVTNEVLARLQAAIEGARRSREVAAAAPLAR